MWRARRGHERHSLTACQPSALVARWEVQAANRDPGLGIDGTDAIPGPGGGSGRAGEPGRDVVVVVRADTHARTHTPQHSSIMI